MPSQKMEYQFQTPSVVVLSDEERRSGHMTMEHVGHAVAALHRDGLVVLENAVDPAHMDNLNNILCPEAEEMAKLPTTHFNNVSPFPFVHSSVKLTMLLKNSKDGKNTGNMSQGPPLDPEYLYEDIWANQPASQVLSAVLGPNPTVNYVNGNTALGGYKARQMVHGKPLALFRQ
jgi:hypothetical protein